MTRNDFIAEVAEAAEMPKVQVKKVFSAAADCLLAAMSDGEDVTLFPGVIFKRTLRAERMGRNPATGESIRIPAKYSPKVTFGKAYKEAVNAE